jgi:hypothetical protein
MGTYSMLKLIITPPMGQLPWSKGIVGHLTGSQLGEALMRGGEMRRLNGSEATTSAFQEQFFKTIHLYTIRINNNIYRTQTI